MREPVESGSSNEYAWLVRAKGSGGPGRYRLRRTVIRVGRDPKNDIVVDAPTTSSHHSEICWEDGGYWIYDLNTANGTFVNGNRVGRAQLKVGSRIRFGPSGPEYAIEQDKSLVDGTMELTAGDTGGARELRPPSAVPSSAPEIREAEKRPAIDAGGKTQAAAPSPAELGASRTTDEDVLPSADSSGIRKLELRPPDERAAPVAAEDGKLPFDTARHARETRAARNTPSDFFISYTQADVHWAEWIAWQLEQAGFSTVIQAWDFRPGSNFMLDMQRAAEEAARTIAVLSPDYLESAYAQQEWASALAADPTGKTGKLLPVRVRECQPKGLLTQVVYVDLVGLSDLAASNTLLSGINRDRAKPGAPPKFPSASTQSPNFPGEAHGESSGPGATPVPVVHIAISCPSELLGTESQHIMIDFEVVSPSAEVSLLVQQEAFLVTGEGSTAGGEFIYSFSAPGRYKKKLRICARQSAEANHPLSIVGYSAGRAMLVRGSYVIRILKPALATRIFSLVKRNRLAAAAAFIAICGLSFWRMPTSARTWMLLHFNPMRPANYLQGSSSLAGKHEWNDFFDSLTVTEAGWVLTNAQVEPGRLLLSGPGLALPKKDLEKYTFTDFGGLFTVRILKGNHVTMLLRVQPGDTPEWKIGYLFRIELNPDSLDGKGGSTIRLTGLKCSSPALEECAPLVADGAAVIGATPCKGEVMFQIRVLAQGNLFTVWPTILEGSSDDDASCLPEILGKFQFKDDAFWPHSLYGNVGFAAFDSANSVSIESFQIVEIDTLEID